MTPTARSLRELRALGYIADVVERWLPHTRLRRDCFGFADILAAHPRDAIFMLVQVTTGAHVSHRLRKAQQRPELLAWLKAGGLFEVHGWQRRAGRWQCRRVSVRPEDLAGVCLDRPRHRRRSKGERQAELFA